MSIINDKKEIFGNIAAIKTLTEGLPKLKLNPSFPSINMDPNTLNFLSDLLSTLVGVESLKDVVIDTLSHNLEGVEQDIKKVLKSELNKIISCDINPSIPTSILHSKYNPSGKGVDLELKKLDFTNLFLMDPHSNSGKLIFNDIDSGVKSTDFNSFLYSTIQDGGTNGWGSSMLENDILDFKFKESGPTNNLLNVRVSEYYSNPANNKKLRDLNNDYIDSIDLFDVSGLLNKIVDNIFGTISTDQKKSKNQLMAEAKLDAIIDGIINQEDDNEIDDSFFKFTNEQLIKFENQVDNQEKGVKVVITSELHETRTNIDTLSEVTKKIRSSDKFELPGIISGALDTISNDITSNIPEIDKYAVKLDFIQDIVKNLMKVIGGILISPKIITILALNFQIIYKEKFDDPIDFILKNKYFIKTIFNGIRDIILEILLTKALKEINVLALLSAADSIKEQINNTKASMMSLLGVPIEVIDRINKFDGNINISI